MLGSLDPETQVPRAGRWESLKPSLSSSTLTTLSRLNFTEMTPVQATAIPLFLTNKDVVVEAVTGSGKTMSYLIPILEILMRREEPLKKYQVGGIIISPTRELARQICHVLEDLLKDLTVVDDNDVIQSGNDVIEVKDAPICRFSHMLFTGGHDLDQDVQQFRQTGAHIIVATPGKLEEFLSKHSSLLNTKELEVLVFDEADRLLDMGFEQSLRNIISHLPKQRRTGLFSATMTEGLSQLARVGLRNPVRVVVKVEDLTNKTVQRTPSTLNIRYLFCKPQQKLLALLKVLVDQPRRKYIVYFNTCLEVDYMFAMLSRLPYLAQHKLHSLHGKMVEKKRNAVYAQFASDQNGVLICTDVAARGIDIPDIDCVVQYDPSQDPQAFVHRCGRTARLGRQGEALVLLHPNEDAYVEYLKLRKIPLERMEFVKPFLPALPSVHVPAFYRSDDDDSANASTMRTIKNPSIREFMHAQLLNDRDLYQKSIRAFVSFLRSYQEHQLKYIFQISKLDIHGVMLSFFLLHKPSCPELKNASAAVKQCEFATLKGELSEEKYMESIRQCHVQLIPFADPIRERARQQAIEKQPKASKKPIGPLKTEAWSKKKEQRQKRHDRKEKKQRKVDAIERDRQAELDRKELEEKRKQEDLDDSLDDDWKELQREQRQLKKKKT